MAATPDRDQRKREAAERALQLVRPGMKLGLGSGSTASFAIAALAIGSAALDSRHNGRDGRQSDREQGSD